MNSKNVEVPVSENIRVIERCSFVALGSFNPAILHPDWFSRHNILPTEETSRLLAEPKREELPEIGVTIEYGSNFIVEPTRAFIHFKSFILKVERNKLEIKCGEKTKFPLLLTCIKKIFKLLPETPINAYGINFNENMKFEENSTKIINKFFNKDKSIDLFFGSNNQNGHTIITNRDEARIRFIIEPSKKIEDGIYISFNFHYDNTSLEAKFILDNINKHFESSLKFSEDLISNYCGKFTERLPEIL